MPDAEVARTLNEKLTFFGSGVNALAEVVVAISSGASVLGLESDVRAVHDFLMGPLQEEQAVDTPEIRYLPETEQNRTFQRRLILRGWEVDAFCRLLAQRELTDDEIDKLDDFKQRFIDEGKKAHIDARV